VKKFHLYFIYGLISVLFGIVFFKSITPEYLVYDEIILQQLDGKEVTLMIPESKVRIFDLPKDINFAGEPVPLKEQEILERFEREIYVNAYWESNLILLMKRANKFLPEMESILAENGIPDDFKYLAIAESGLLNVVSPAGARGFWQFMPSTAKEFQLEVSDEVDERYHFEKATLAACRYLKKSYAQFGSWTSVAASYNMGMAGYSKRKKEQKMENYYDLLLNEETSRYLFRILAFKELFENPDRYGFHLTEEDLYQLPNFRYLKIDQTVPDLAAWAIRHNSNYKELKIHNPWLRAGKIKVAKGKDYFIKLPV
jgi:membrane-bound lytic murein transglycosylase D